MRKGDLLIIGVFLVLGLTFVVFSRWQSLHAGEGAILVVTDTLTKTEMTYDLRKDTRLEVEGPKGISTIEIKDGKARFLDSPCPDKLCVNFFGWIESEVELSFCLPNQLLLGVRE